jgi:hypothetical protein
MDRGAGRRTHLLAYVKMNARCGRLDSMGWLTLLLQVEPAIPGIVKDIKALFAKHPALADPAAQAAFIAALGQAAIDTNDAALALIAADQQAHPQP